MSKVSESQIEAYLKKKVEALGGKCYKWVSPGNIGVPDRIVMLPKGLMYFVELKSEKGVLSPKQVKEAKRIVSFGQAYIQIRSKEEADAFIKTAENHLVIVMRAKEVVDALTDNLLGEVMQ